MTYIKTTIKDNKVDMSSLALLPNVPLADQITVRRVFDMADVAELVTTPVTPSEIVSLWTLPNASSSGSTMYTADSATKVLTFSSTLSDYTWLNTVHHTRGANIQLPLPVEGETVYVIQHVVEDTSSVDWTGITYIKSKDLNTSYNQILSLFGELRSIEENKNDLDILIGIADGICELDANSLVPTAFFPAVSGSAPTNVLTTETMDGLADVTIPTPLSQWANYELHWNGTMWRPGYPLSTIIDVTTLATGEVVRMSTSTLDASLVALDELSNVTVGTPYIGQLLETTTTGTWRLSDASGTGNLQGQTVMKWNSDDGTWKPSDALIDVTTNIPGFLYDGVPAAGTAAAIDDMGDVIWTDTNGQGNPTDDDTWNGKFLVWDGTLTNTAGIGGARAAIATVTITNYAELNGDGTAGSDNVRLIAADTNGYNFYCGDHSSVAGTWEAATSNEVTATSLMNVINTSSGPAGTRFTATVNGAVVTISQATVGTAGNTTVTLTDSGTAGMTKTNFLGGVANGAGAWTERVKYLGDFPQFTSASVDITPVNGNTITDGDIMYWSSGAFIAGGWDDVINSWLGSSTWDGTAAAPNVLKSDGAGGYNLSHAYIKELDNVTAFKANGIGPKHGAVLEYDAINSTWIPNPYDETGTEGVWGDTMVVAELNVDYGTSDPTNNAGHAYWESVIGSVMVTRDIDITGIQILPTYRVRNSTGNEKTCSGHSYTGYTHTYNWVNYAQYTHPIKDGLSCPVGWSGSMNAGEDFWGDHGFQITRTPSPTWDGNGDPANSPGSTNISPYVPYRDNPNYFNWYWKGTGSIWGGIHATPSMLSYTNLYNQQYLTGNPPTNNSIVPFASWGNHWSGSWVPLTISKLYKGDELNFKYINIWNQEMFQTNELSPFRSGFRRIKQMSATLIIYGNSI